ncbi:hypothetical protein [Pandoraea sputorum]|uniref:hypothetical protein n=1 Tax=Pandoraea sputorum TaxID=93222 RepID=UPI002AF6CC2D|nr:hypothetical protein [Pandoraea sputorum]
MSDFLALPSSPQGARVRQVNFKERLAGGREYNDAGSPRYASDLRGRDAITTLCPLLNAANVQVQGKSTGLPVIALTNASATHEAMARARVLQRQNDPSSVFQLVGNGELIEAQKMQLTREEKAHL